VKKRIAFLAFAEPHQHLHWIPVALALARRPDVEVTVLSGSRAALKFIEGFDPARSLGLRHLWLPRWRREGLFTPPKRTHVALLHGKTIASFPFIVTTEVTSSILYREPGFSSKIIHIKHGAGDVESSFNARHAHFDLTLVYGQKHKDRLIERGLATDDDCLVVGCGKFELAKPPRKLFANDLPVALYNPHWKEHSTFPRFGEALIREMEKIPGWNFIVAPHVKLSGPEPATSAPNIIIDRRSPSSIDMTYTQAADVYIGDVSSQVYEFVWRPRPCIFLNFDRIAWQGRPDYLHWSMGQVIETIEQLGPALARARDVQPSFERAQRDALAYSIEHHEEPSSNRQADIIVEFMEGRIAPRRSDRKPGVGDGESRYIWLLRRWIRSRYGSAGCSPDAP